LTDSSTPLVKYSSPKVGDRLELGQVAALDEAAGQGELGALGVHRDVRHGQVVGDAGADLGPVGVEGADRGDVDQVHVLDEVGQLVDEALDRHQALDGQHRLRVGGDRIGDAAHGDVLDVRGLGAEDRDDLVGLALHFQRLQVVRHGHQVHLGRELHRRVAPVAVGEDAELAAIDEALQPLMHAAHLVLAVEVPGREALAQRRRLVRIGLQRRGDIDPVERREVVEVHDLVMHRVRQDDQVADELGVQRHFHLQGVLDRAHRGDGMHRGAHAADALGDGPGVARVAAEQDQFDAAPHLAGGPGLLDAAAVDIDVDAQVAFDAGDRINRYALGHFLSPSLQWAACASSRWAARGNGG
jgi:hypothetical protein